MRGWKPTRTVRAIACLSEIIASLSGASERTSTYAVLKFNKMSSQKEPSTSHEMTTSETRTSSWHPDWANDSLYGTSNTVYMSSLPFAGDLAV